MNIEQLAEQCLEGEHRDSFNISKFVELIAEECAKVCDEVGETGGDADECATEIRGRSKA